MVQFIFSRPFIRLAIFFSVAGLLGFGYYLEFIKGLEPCPLCITQRFFLLVSGLLGLLAAIHKPAQTGT
jgi:disulfide bond formation protein DsbB